MFSSHIPVIGSDEYIEQIAIKPWRRKRARVAKEYGLNYLVNILEDDPTNIQEDFSSLDVDLWKEGINIEMNKI